MLITNSATGLFKISILSMINAKAAKAIFADHAKTYTSKNPTSSTSYSQADKVKERTS